MRVLFISRTDWASAGALLSKSLRSIGVESMSVCINPRQFENETSSAVCNKRDLKDLVHRYDVIQFMHSEYIETGYSLKNKSVVVYHGGSRYRRDPRKVLKFWNGRADVHIVQTADLLGLGAFPEEWLLPPVDTDRIQPSYISVPSNKRIIMHCPSDPRKKGTKEFEDVINSLKKSPSLKDKFTYEYMSKIGWSESINRKSKCDIYFDACKPMIEGKPYGFWGMAALEAAALGKIVITHFKYGQKYYIDRYGYHNLKSANSMEEVKHQLVKHITMEVNEFKMEQRKTREWVVRNHSMKVVGQRLLDIYNKYS